MNELTLHPRVYKTGHSTGLISVLENVWVRNHHPGDGTIYIVSGFANYNGGIRFYDVLRQHVDSGGRLIAIFGGSTSQRLSSKQVVKEMLACGAEVHLINRKRILHAKCYGTKNNQGQRLVVTSGNFTGPGMSQNIELSVSLDPNSVEQMGFCWDDLVDQMLDQKWDFYQPTLADLANPAWQLLYDEEATDIRLDDSDEMTMILRLGHSDTVRINAAKGTDAAKGTQYFWLSKDAFDFFPPLTHLNRRGYKSTYSCLITMHYVDLHIKDEECRVTFEADNNLDFRLGTGPLRYTKITAEGDLAAITRVKESQYELRFFQQGAPLYNALAPYAVNFIGHAGKKYGYLSNQQFEKLIGKKVGLPLPEDSKITITKGNGKRRRRRDSLIYDPSDPIDQFYDRHGRGDEHK